MPLVLMLVLLVRLLRLLLLRQTTVSPALGPRFALPLPNTRVLCFIVTSAAVRHAVIKASGNWGSISQAAHCVTYHSFFTRLHSLPDSVDSRRRPTPMDGV